MLVESMRPQNPGTEWVFFVCNTSDRIEKRRHDSRIFSFVLIPSICIKACFKISKMYIYCPYNKKKITR